MALSLGALAGAPWGAAAVYVLTIGWIGQMVNGHIYHIGIRLIATMTRSDDDETQPSELLAPVLSWTSFALFAAAVATGGFALVFGVTELLGIAGLAGFLGWCAMVLNVTIATRRARRHRPRRSATPVRDCEAPSRLARDGR